MPVHFGGPVQTERGFVLHDTPGNWQSTLRITTNLALTTSRDILEAVGQGEGPRPLDHYPGLRGLGSRAAGT